jgi:hypothetical protein
MEMAKAEAKQASMGFGCNLILWVGGLAFLALMIFTLVPSAMEFAAASFHCPNATKILSDTSDGGSVQTRAGSATTVSTTVTEITCTFSDGSEKVIGNDTMVITGFGLALALGAGLGLLITLVLQVFARLYRPST